MRATRGRVQTPDNPFANTDDGELRGSARSIAQVNIFETLCSLSEYFTGFGGHAQAAGISMDESKFDDFVKAANELILSTHDKHDFTHEISCEMELPIDMDFCLLQRNSNLWNRRAIRILVRLSL